jgi:taurine dioxygenase
MKLEIRPIQGEFCAEVLGADLSRTLDEAAFAEIDRAWTRHSILIFRDVHMTP